MSSIGKQNIGRCRRSEFRFAYQRIATGNLEVLRYEETFIMLEGEIEAIVDSKTEMLRENNIVIISADTWHEFKNRSKKLVFMINIHPVPEMITEWA